MEMTEKVAHLYLRLNGFFLMPRFTIFGKERLKHVDILGFRPKKSKEIVEGMELVIDKEFVDKLGGNSKDIAIWAEVGSGRSFPEEKEEYIKKIFGNPECIKKVHFDFDSNNPDLAYSTAILTVTSFRCRNLIMSRFLQMESKEFEDVIRNFTKVGSWNWSNDILGELLFLRRIGLLGVDART